MTRDISLHIIGKSCGLHAFVLGVWMAFRQLALPTNDRSDGMVRAKQLAARKSSGRSSLHEAKVLDRHDAVRHKSLKVFIFPQTPALCKCLIMINIAKTQTPIRRETSDDTDNKATNGESGRGFFRIEWRDQEILDLILKYSICCEGSRVTVTICALYQSTLTPLVLVTLHRLSRELAVS